MKSIIVFLSVFFFYNLSLSGQPKDDYLKGQLIVKIKSEFSQKCFPSRIEIPELKRFIQTENVNSVQKLFPKHQAPVKKSANSNLVDLSGIYRFYFNENAPLEKLIRLLEKSTYIEYAEKEYLNRLSYTPNDTMNHRQWYLGAIDVFRAWDIEKGDSSVVIAIIDTGSDTAHADLLESFAFNYDDPINGIDDDGDGYIDNFNGWDVANNDNDPSYSISGHGTNVASIAAATTDNTTGISGVGFNCRILTVRIDDENTGQLTAAFEGIVYAADQGAFIINNSWGSFSFSNFGEDIVNYAALNKGALVIGASGNGPFSGPNAGVGTEAPFYPAAYEHVLSIGSLLEGDTIKESSNFGYWLDLFAPGENMLTARERNSYGISGGTSMAAPVVAGVAGLIKSHFPNLTAKQVIHKMLSTADNVEAVNDAKFKGKMGEGKVNVFRALTENQSPGIDFINREISDRNNEVFSAGDTLRISGDFINYLAPATNVNASLKVFNDQLKIINGNSTLGNIGTLDSSNNSNAPFLVEILAGIGFNQKVEFEVSIEANNGSYLRKFYFDLALNPDFLTINENDLTVTLASNGSIGFSGKNNELGEGIKYKDGNSLLFDGSFIIGNSPTYVADRFRNENEMDRDFEIQNPVTPISSTQSVFQSEADFNDQKLSDPAKISIRQINFILEGQEFNSSIIYTYRLKNISNQAILNIHAGMIIDWDILSFSKNKIDFDPERKMGISFSTDTALFVGVKVLTDSMGHFHYGIDNTQNGLGGVNLSDGFSDAEKFQVISSNRAQAGMSSAEGNDIIDVNSSGPFNLEPDSSKLISFSVTVSESMSDLFKQTDSIQNAYRALLLSLKELPEVTENSLLIFPNPANERLNLLLNLKQNDEIELRVRDLQGSLIYEDRRFFGRGENLVQLNSESWKTGVYLLEVKGNTFFQKNKFVVSH